ncbi:uncharacterized protein METZ01_LOCUS213317 [marine metagenome]|uniref:Uncharacterized protein n=1 Tax=marine metagenome TaxID=408172 RepID=A0A382FE32_9ZZZZ
MENLVFYHLEYVGPGSIKHPGVTFARWWRL